MNCILNKKLILGTGFSYEETQSNRVSDFPDFVCSVFPKAILFFKFYFTLL